MALDSEIPSEQAHLDRMDRELTNTPGTSSWRDAVSSRNARNHLVKTGSGCKRAIVEGKRTDKNVCPTSMRRSLLASRTVEPKIDRFFHFGRRLVWQRDLAAFASGCIAGINCAKHDQAIFARSLRSLFAAHAVREVGQFLRRAVIPEFLENGIRPTFRCGSFFDCVAVSVFTVGRQRIAHVEIGVRAAGFAENFDAVVHPAAARPAIFHQSDRTIGEFENAQRIVLGLGLFAMNVRAHLTIDRLDRRASKKPVAESDSVTPKIHQRAATGSVHVPEPCAVWPKMLFALLDEINVAESAC